MDQRCDQNTNCDDQTDERNCKIVHVNPDQYQKVTCFIVVSIIVTFDRISDHLHF